MTKTIVELQSEVERMDLRRKNAELFAIRTAEDNVRLLNRNSALVHENNHLNNIERILNLPSSKKHDINLLCRHLQEECGDLATMGEIVCNVEYFLEEDNKR